MDPGEQCGMTFNGAAPREFRLSVYIFRPLLRKRQAHPPVCRVRPHAHVKNLGWGGSWVDVYYWFLKKATMEPPVLIQIDSNPNCPPMDGLVFQPRMPPRAISQVRTSRHGMEMWCEVTGVDESGMPCPAMACLIEDSGDGACYLIFGGAWGLRLKASGHDWDLNDSDQWGEAYLLLPSDESDLRLFPSASQ